MEKSNTQLLRNLSAAVNGQAATATFACGGSVEGRVTIRWDVDDHLQQLKIFFPLSEDDNTSQRALVELVQRCQPATFGVGNRDVLDEKYRKASKLDNTAFSSDFHPHDFGIVDAVQQILMPSTLAKSGEANVDSRRPLMGGTLRVRHRNQSIDFAWGSDNPQGIQWAAFYGDCEHEVLEVTQGHRITLTYNLYCTLLNNLACPISDPTNLPLYSTVKEMLWEDNFMRQGGIIGFFCHHAYAHSTESGRKMLPGGLKGIDLAVYSVFHGQGLKTNVQPILHKHPTTTWRTGSSNSWGGLSVRELMQDTSSTDKEEGDWVESRLDAMEPEIEEGSEEDDYYGRQHIDEVFREHGTIVGTKLHGPKSNDTLDEDLDYKGVIDNWPHEKILKIVWMNEPQHEDFAYAGLAYGNNAELDFKFSAAAILVRVPNRGARRVAKLAEKGSKNPFLYAE
ncbi:MAG: hypothetical protein Q9222_005764 [Ikaeria aurantiellina]